MPFYGGKEIVRLASMESTVSNAYISEEKYTRILHQNMKCHKMGDILIVGTRNNLVLRYVVRDR